MRLRATLPGRKKVTLASEASSGEGDPAYGSHHRVLSGLARRQHPRVQLLPLHDVRFELEPEGHILELVNLSVSGMGLLSSPLGEPLSALKANDLIEGRLYCADASANVAARVVYVNEKHMGCQFVGHDMEANQLIQSYFNIELNALSMIGVNPSMLQDDPDGVPHWIHGKNNCEIFFISQGDEVVRFNLTFFGNYIEGVAGKRPKYGQVFEEEDSLGKPRHKGAALIRWDTGLAEKMEEYAIRFLKSVPHLSDPHRQALLRMIGGERK